MKIKGTTTLLSCCLAMLLWGTGCQVDDITDFGFDGAISGTVRDGNGNIVAGNITSGNFAVQALGEGDQVATSIRIKGDGTYQHTKLYPKRYKVWITGPVVPHEDTLVIDFSRERVVAKDIVVTPFVTLPAPELKGSPGGTTLTVSYRMIANEGMSISRRELYCSTNPYPDASTGSGPFYQTQTVSLSSDEGEATISGLTPGTQYYIRTGAQAEGASGFNYSEQILVSTP